MSFLKRLFRCLFVWRLEQATVEEISKAQAIVTQAYSRLKNGRPGSANEEHAWIARRLWEKYGLPVIPQEEIAMADPELPCFEIAGGSPDGRSTFSWNTWEVAKVQADVCKKNGWDTAIVVVNPVGAGRTKWVYETLGFKPLLVIVPMYDDYYQPDLVHFSLRKKWRAYVREFFCRLLFLFWGRI